MITIDIIWSPKTGGHLARQQYLPIFLNQNKQYRHPCWPTVASQLYIPILQEEYNINHMMPSARERLKPWVPIDVWHNSPITTLRYSPAYDFHGNGMLLMLIVGMSTIFSHCQIDHSAEYWFKIWKYHTEISDIIGFETHQWKLKVWIGKENLDFAVDQKKITLAVLFHIPVPSFLAKSN
jgi:hypothetical protein